MFKPFTDYLAKCTGKRVIYYPVQSNAAEIEAMRSGRLHVAGFSTGPTGFAVNLAGAVPFAVKGTEKEFAGLSPDRRSSKAQPLPETVRPQGQARRAHVAVVELRQPRAARAVPEEGSRPTRTTDPLMSGRHDKSALGVALRRLRHGAGRLRRVPPHGRARHDQGRRLPHHLPSPKFPTSSFAYAHDLKPELASKMRDCFYDFRFTPEMMKEFDGDDRFFPINYKRHWEVVREIAEDSGTPFNKAAYEAETKREAEARAQGQQAAHEAVIARIRSMNAHAPAIAAGCAASVDRSLVIRKLRKEYGAGKPVLHDISLDVAGRGMTAIIGPSGTGKIDADPLHQPPGRADRGRVLFDGRTWPSLPRAAVARARRHIGMVFQEYNLVERLYRDRERAVRAARLRSAVAGLAAAISARRHRARLRPARRRRARRPRHTSAPIRCRAGSASASASRAP